MTFKGMSFMLFNKLIRYKNAAKRINIFIQFRLFQYSCEMCTGSKVPDSTADAKQDEERKECKETAGNATQSNNNVSLEGREKEHMDTSEIQHQKQ